jgi:hypothetical protein
MIQLDTIQLTDRVESQIDWVDQLTWLPIGQQIRYALAGNPVIMENPRMGRPITLVAELPWCWLSANTVASLYSLASELNYTFSFIYGDFSANVRFRRDAGPLEFTPVTPLKEYYTGSIYLIEV